MVFLLSIVNGFKMARAFAYNLAQSGFTGLPELIDRISTLESKVQKKIAFKAVTQAANVIKKKARQNAKKIDDKNDEEKIYPYIKVKRSPRESKRMNAAVVRLGIEGGAKYTTRVPPTYWRYVEYGTEDTPARSFMRDAINATTFEALNKFFVVFRAEIDKALAAGPVAP